MRALRPWWLDRVWLVLAATAFLAAIIAVAMITDANGLREPWGLFIFQTLAFPPIIVHQTRRIFRARGRAFVRRWPLPAVGLGSFAIHCLVLGYVIYRFEPDWRMAHWIVIDFAELSAIGIVAEVAYEYSTSERPFNDTLRHTFRQLTGSSH